MDKINQIKTGPRKEIPRGSGLHKGTVLERSFPEGFTE